LNLANGKSTVVSDQISGGFWPPHHDAGAGILAPTEFTLQNTDYKSFGAHRKFSVNNGWNPNK
jgi:hypothetical protein